jgi:hypothetical protein
VVWADRRRHGDDGRNVILAGGYTPATGDWHCFGCGADGNALDLWAAVTKQPLYAAVLDLCRRLPLDIPWRPARSPPGP